MESGLFHEKNQSKKWILDIDDLFSVVFIISYTIHYLPNIIGMFLFLQIMQCAN